MSKKVIIRVSAYICAFCIICLTVLSAFMPSVNALESIGKVNLSCVIDGNPVDGLKWSLYYTAQKNSAGEYVLSGKFSEYPVSLDNLTEDNIQNVANTLENYTNTDSISPDESAVTDKKGCASFNVTKQGLYLLTGNSFVKGTKRYIPTAFFVEISNDTSLPVTVFPKFSIEDITPESKTYSVTKKWNGDKKYIDKRPVSVKIEIYKNNKIYKTVTLSEENNWTYTWTATGDNEWTVKEINVNKYYNVVYKNFLNEFEIVNTINKKVLSEGKTDEENKFSSSDGDNDNDNSNSNNNDNDNNNDKSNDSNNHDESNSDESNPVSDSQNSDSDYNSTKTHTSTNSDSEGENLPQTGQLWWPVPVLAIAGLIFIAVGIRMGNEKKDNSKNEEE